MVVGFDLSKFREKQLKKQTPTLAALLILITSHPYCPIFFTELAGI